jgi:hypothetical protein
VSNKSNAAKTAMRAGDYFDERIGWCIDETVVGDRRCLAMRRVMIRLTTEQRIEAMRAGMIT